MIREIKIPINRAFNTAPITNGYGQTGFFTEFTAEQGNCQRTENDIPIIIHGGTLQGRLPYGVPGDEKGSDWSDIRLK